MNDKGEDREAERVNDGAEERRKNMLEKEMKNVDFVTKSFGASFYCFTFFLVSFFSFFLFLI